MRLTALTCVQLFMCALALNAQSVHGRVQNAATGAPISGADVSVDGRDLHALSDSSGEFRIPGLSAGVNLIRVRKIGFAVLLDTIALSAGQDIQAAYYLTVQTPTLDTLRTVAEGRKYISPALRGFEERRLSGGSGYFISEAELRRNDGKNLSNIILSRTAGLTIMPSRPAGGSVLVSTRKTCAGRAMSVTCTPCYVTVYQDGQLIYRFSDLNTAPPIDVQRVLVEDLGGVEFYPSTGVGPAEFNSTNSGCGTLLLWSREK